MSPFTWFALGALTGIAAVIAAIYGLLTALDRWHGRDV